MDEDIYFVYITTADMQEAFKIGETLVKERLAACVNIFDGMKSIYHWEGKICNDSEAVLIAKTDKKLIERLSNRVKELHSYSCPCIVVLPVIDGNEQYLSWIRQETTS